VDSIQGREFEVTLLLTTKNSFTVLEATSHELDFLKFPNRLNMATSRARCIRIVLGNAYMLWLYGGPLWQQFIILHIQNNMYMQAAKFERNWETKEQKTKRLFEEGEQRTKKKLIKRDNMTPYNGTAT
jgi:superfamily I DNA and/or RNA helicase